MRKTCAISIVAVFLLANATTLKASIVFATGVDSVNYNIAAWSIRTDWTGAWSGKTPTYFQFDSPAWNTRYTNTSGVQYWTGQTMSGAAVVTDVFSDSDLDAINHPFNSGWAAIGGISSPISIWEHGGQFLQQSGGDNDDWADDTYWASNEYGWISDNPKVRSTVVTEFTASFAWDGIGNRIEGKILADDWAQVYINDTLVYTTDACAYDAVEFFTYDGVLTLGSNSLKVIVYNTGQGAVDDSPTAGPTALQLELNAVPEPATLIIWSLLGLMAVGYGAWRRRR